LIEGSGALTPGPNRLIEPDENRDKNTEKRLNFSIWEEKYGRNLSELEQIEIRENCVALLRVLLSEHQREEKKNG
jgi:hypothetical protein